METTRKMLLSRVTSVRKTAKGTMTCSALAAIDGSIARQRARRQQSQTKLWQMTKMHAVHMAARGRRRRQQEEKAQYQEQKNSRQTTTTDEHQQGREEDDEEEEEHQRERSLGLTSKLLEVAATSPKWRTFS